MCSWRFESGKLKVYLSVSEFLYKLQAFYFYSFFIFPKIDILMTVEQMGKKILCLLFRHEEAETISVFQQNATFLQTCEYTIYILQLFWRSQL